MLLAAFWLALSSLTNDSPTMDEQNHMARGLALLRTGDPRLSLEHPPLINSWSALPLLSTPTIVLPLDDPSWQATDGWYRFASLLLWENNRDIAQQLVVLSRIPIVHIFLLMACVGYRFASKLWHPRAGLLAALLLLFDPNLMAHGRYTTTDVGGAATLMLALFMLWRLWKGVGAQNERGYMAGGIGRLLLATLALGMAFASKMSNLGFVPILGLLAILPLYDLRWRWHWAMQRLGLYLLAGLGSIAVVWMIYGFQWGPLAFASEQFAALNGIHAPMPTFWAGIERIATTASDGRIAYLLGDFSDNGFPLYFPIAFLIKTPLVALLLLACGLLYVLNFHETRKQAFFLLIPALFYFGTTTRSGLNIGYRHLTPMLVLLYVMAAGFTPEQWRANNRLTLRSFLTLFCGAGLILSNVVVYPHYVGQFNGIVSTARGWEALADSNVDWGQDLLRLRAWADKNNVETLKLSYFGAADPSVYLDYSPLPGFPTYHRDIWEAVPFNTSSPEPGVYAISVANFHELHHQAPENKVVFRWFRERQPDARIGSFHVYIVE